MLRSSALVLISLIFAISLAPAGCGYDPLGPSTQVRPRRGAIVGTWRLDEQGRNMVPAAVKDGDMPALILNEDGTFSARDLPDWWNYIRRWRNGKELGQSWILTSGSGKWSLSKYQEVWIVTLVFSELPGKPQGISMPLHLYNQKAPYSLGAILGDPDEGRFLIFEKTGPAPRADVVPE